MTVSLSDHFTYQKLLRFVAPSILMMIITSIYSIVDGFFVSNFVGKNSFAALNLIFPVIMARAAARSSPKRSARVSPGKRTRSSPCSSSCLPPAARF